MVSKPQSAQFGAQLKGLRVPLRAPRVETCEIGVGGGG